MKSGEYWAKRFDQIEQAANNKSTAYYQSLEQKYARAAKQIDDKITAWYQRLADNNGVNMTEARKLLTNAELKEFKWTVKDYIKYGEQNALDQSWMKELENASAKFHINRLEALKIDARQQIEVLTGGQVDDVDQLLRNVYTDSYYKGCFEIQKGIGVGFDVGKLDENLVAKLVSKPWSVDGQNFSEKLWTNKTKLLNTLDQNISKMVLTGESPKKTIKAIQQAMDTSKSNAARLVYTEQAYFTTEAQHDTYDELDVEEYEIVATLDETTCDECGGYDGEHYPLKDMEPGVNAPPFHPYCRCTTVPYFDDADYGTRIARDQEGKNYKVPSNMTYKEWKEIQGVKLLQ